MCSYDAGPNHDITPAPNPLTGEWEVPDGFDQVAADLSSVPAVGRGAGCTEMGGPVTRQLVGLEYGDTAVWVSATDEPNRCIPASNGRFRGSGAIGHRVATAVDEGGWVQPTHGYRSVCGERVADGRPEGRVELVPESPTGVAVCVADSDSGTFSVQEPLRGQLLDQLRELPTRPASGGVRPCAGEPRYELTLRYATGPVVAMEVGTGDCGATLTTGDLEADVTPELARTLAAATTHG